MSYSSAIASMAPALTTEVNADDEVDDVILLSYGILYVFNNDQAVPAAIYEASLPVIVSGDIGRRVHVTAKYDTDPLLGASPAPGWGVVKVNDGSGDLIRKDGTTVDSLNVKVNDEELVFQHDGAVPGVWYMV